MKAQTVKSNIFRGLIAALITTTFAVNSEAKTKDMITLDTDTAKMTHGKMDDKPVIVFATYRFKDGQLTKMLNIISELARKTRAEKGNLFYKVHQSNSDANTIIFLEGYKDEAGLEAHRNSEHYKTLIIGKLVPVLEERKVVVATELNLD